MVVAVDRSHILQMRHGSLHEGALRDDARDWVGHVVLRADARRSHRIDLLLASRRAIPSAASRACQTWIQTMTSRSSQTQMRRCCSALSRCWRGLLGSGTLRRTMSGSSRSGKGCMQPLACPTHLGLCFCNFRTRSSFGGGQHKQSSQRCSIPRAAGQAAARYRGVG